MSEKAIVTLLSTPALGFVQDLRRKVDADPSYLEDHRKEIAPLVEHFLVRGGIIYDQAILERESVSFVREAINRLRAIQKPPRD